MLGDSKKLGESLRKIRIENNFTQKNIADVLGIDRTTYTYYETGASNPSPKTLIALSQIYNISVGYLMGVEENRPIGAGAKTKVSVASGDPISMLKEKEKELLMYFRVLDEEKKKEVVELLKKLSKENKDT